MPGSSSPAGVAHELADWLSLRGLGGSSSSSLSRMLICLTSLRKWLTVMRPSESVSMRVRRSCEVQTASREWHAQRREATHPPRQAPKVEDRSTREGKASREARGEGGGEEDE